MKGTHVVTLRDGTGATFDDDLTPVFEERSLVLFRKTGVRIERIYIVPLDVLATYVCGGYQR